MSGPIELGWLELAAAAALLLINGLLSLWLRLGLERKLLVATLRTTVQLSLLGYLLMPVFELQQPALVLAVCAAMVLLAGREAAGRSSRVYRGIQLTSLTAMAVGAGITALLATVVIIDVEPWWSPRYLIPLLGMLLGNSITGVSLGMDRVLSRLDEGRAEVESLLAFGASPWEAARPIAAEGLRTGMIPILNSMSVVGLVTIPGMMTGQILGGTPPVQAARYQMLILFLIAAAVALGAGISVLVSVRASFDEQWRLCVADKRS